MKSSLKLSYKAANGLILFRRKVLSLLRFSAKRATPSKKELKGSFDLTTKHLSIIRDFINKNECY